jgi:dienelactone hydrolase
MELIIVEIIAASFLLLPLARTLFKGLWHVNGLALLPALSLALIIGILPAYGFRPECIPLFVLAVIININNRTAFFSIFSRLKNDDYRDRGPAYTFSCLVLLGCALGAALYFLPPPEAAVDGGAETMSLYDAKRRETLWLRIYTPAGFFPSAGAEAPPLIILAPPAAGSVPVINAVCSGLAEKGFTVLSYSRPGFDSPALDGNGGVKRPGAPALLRLAAALIRGYLTDKAGAASKALEAGRKADVEFLLMELSGNKTLREKAAGSGGERIILAGYGAAGAAFTALAGSKNFIAGHSGVQAVIAVESPLFSESGGAKSPPRPEIPVLFIVSDRVKQERTGRYAAILTIARSSPAPVMIAALDGAGIFDHSDSPRLYPVYSFLFRGLETDRTRNAAEFSAGTAALMANFAVHVLKSSPEDPAGEIAGPLPQITPLDGVYLEGEKGWNLDGGRPILEL